MTGLAATTQFVDDTGIRTVRVLSIDEALKVI